MKTDKEMFDEFGFEKILDFIPKLAIRNYIVRNVIEQKHMKLDGCKNHYEEWVKMEKVWDKFVDKNPFETLKDLVKEYKKNIANAKKRKINQLENPSLYESNQAMIKYYTQFVKDLEEILE